MSLVTLTFWPLRLIGPLAVVIPATPSTVPIVSAFASVKLKPAAPAEPASVPTELLEFVRVTAPVALAANWEAVIGAVCVMLPPASILTRLVVPVTPAFRPMLPPAVILNAPPPDELMGALTMMSVVAFSLSELPVLQLTGSTTLMKPAPVPTALAVVTVTDELSKRILKNGTVSRESAALVLAWNVYGPRRREEPETQVRPLERWWDRPRCRCWSDPAAGYRSAMRRTRVDLALHVQVMARSLDVAAVTRGSPAARRQEPIDPGGILRPDDRRPAVAVLDRVGLDGGAGLHGRLLRIGDAAVLALPAATDQRLAAAARAAHVDQGAVAQHDLVRGDVNLSALVALGGRDGSVDIGAGLPLEHHLAALGADAGGLDQAAVFELAGEDSDGIALQRSQIDSAVLGRLQFQMDALQAAAGQFDLLAGQQAASRRWPPAPALPCRPRFAARSAPHRRCAR